jgi:Flp pilus assembly protein TadG
MKSPLPVRVSFPAFRRNPFVSARPARPAAFKVWHKRAAAVVELAVCLPVIVILVLGALEGANILFCRQAMVEAAYEACKHASRTDGTNALATTLADDVLRARRINVATINISPGNVSAVKAGGEVSVNIVVDSDTRTYTSLGLFSSRPISVTATMQKE